jgi:hypothetical protein
MALKALALDGGAGNADFGGGGVAVPLTVACNAWLPNTPVESHARIKIWCVPDEAVTSPLNEVAAPPAATLTLSR